MWVEGVRSRRGTDPPTALRTDHQRRKVYVSQDVSWKGRVRWNTGTQVTLKLVAPRPYEKDIGCREPFKERPPLVDVLWTTHP